MTSALILIFCAFVLYTLGVPVSKFFLRLFSVLTLIGLVCYLIACFSSPFPYPYTTLHF